MSRTPSVTSIVERPVEGDLPPAGLGEDVEVREDAGALDADAEDARAGLLQEQLGEREVDAIRPVRKRWKRYADMPVRRSLYSGSRSVPGDCRLSVERVELDPT